MKGGAAHVASFVVLLKLLEGAIVADRLKYSFVRTGQITQAGIVEVDVFNPADAKEIAQRLKDGDFASFLVSEETIVDPQYRFAIVEEVPGG